MDNSLRSSPARSADFKRRKSCRPTPVNSFTNAPAARKFFVRNPAIVAYIALTEQHPVRISANGETHAVESTHVTDTIMTTDPSTERFERTIAVVPDDIDQLDHVNNIVYLRWVQEAAVSHWENAATEQEKESVIWVVVRHEIDYRSPARLGDTIIARTWVGTTVKNYFERHTEIIRTTDAKVLARARTLWCPLDRRSGKPTRVDDDIRRRFSVPTSVASEE